MELVLAVDLIVKGNAGMGQGLVLDQICHIAGLRLGLAQKLSSDGHVIEKVPDNDRGPVRGPDLFHIQSDLVGAFRRKDLVGSPDACQVVPGLGDHLHLGHRGDA